MSLPDVVVSFGSCGILAHYPITNQTVAICRQHQQDDGSPCFVSRAALVKGRRPSVLCFAWLYGANSTSVSTCEDHKKVAQELDTLQPTSYINARQMLRDTKNSEDLFEPELFVGVYDDDDIVP